MGRGLENVHFSSSQTKGHPNTRQTPRARQQPSAGLQTPAAPNATALEPRAPGHCPRGPRKAAGAKTDAAGAHAPGGLRHLERGHGPPAPRAAEGVRGVPNRNTRITHKSFRSTATGHRTAIEGARRRACGQSHTRALASRPFFRRGWLAQVLGQTLRCQLPFCVPLAPPQWASTLFRSNAMTCRQERSW